MQLLETRLTDKRLYFVMVPDHAFGLLQ